MVIMNEPVKQENIRNFCIIAHVDHGKTTLTDRILEMTGTVSKREMRAQFLDSMDLERERGITIKLKAVRLNYPLLTTHYQLNLIDTPGHVDFGYEVSRSLAACEGAVLVVDASQGIQAQTVANFYKAQENHLAIIPFVNKIDLPVAKPEETSRALTEAFGFKKEEIILGSAKTGQGVEALLAAIVSRIPPPSGRADSAPRALVFDSVFDEYKGVIAFVKVVDGCLDLGQAAAVTFLATKTTVRPLEVGYLRPNFIKSGRLGTGEVGYVATGLKEIQKVRVGDTITIDQKSKIKDQDDQKEIEPLPGYKEPKPMVFLGLYPLDQQDFLKLRQALEKLKLTDASLVVEAESSGALGLGFRCGFLGLLHAEIIQERLERDYGLKIISTAPSVFYKVELTNGQTKEIRRATDLPEPSSLKSIAEPMVELSIYSPQVYTGSILKLATTYRIQFQNLEYLGPIARLVFTAPLAEVITDFYDRLKSVSSGFASLDYEFLEFRPGDLDRLDILVAGQKVEPLARIVPAAEAADLGRKILIKLKATIRRHQFVVVLQAAVGGKILARQEIPALRKNVLAKMSGGHRERKDKLLDRQREGKKRLKSFGSVEIPQEAFRVVLERS